MRADLKGPRHEGAWPLYLGCCVCNWDRSESGSSRNKGDAGRHRADDRSARVRGRSGRWQPEHRRGPAVPGGDPATLPIATAIATLRTTCRTRSRTGHARAHPGLPRPLPPRQSPSATPSDERDYTRPLKAMRDFFYGLEPSSPLPPPEQLVAAALGPKMLDLAASGPAGTYRYFIDVAAHQHTPASVWPGCPPIAPEVAVVVEQDPDARRHPRPRVRADPTTFTTTRPTCSSSASRRRTSPSGGSRTA